ncbi:MAG: putative Adenylosuccinate lyase [Chthonomonadaceae bacterium]|nr:putative Adenylosuccinate lyase [Chthonomonadaceae bacterium]
MLDGGRRGSLVETPPMATIKPEFNERLYEFCVNFQIVATAGALIAGYVPGIPSPQDEALLGWDAAVPMPAYGHTFLLQYKVSRKTTARASANAKFWDVYGTEYWRFPLHRDGDGAYTQHQLLLDAHDVGVEPLYCAPLVHGRGELVKSLQDGSLMEQSCLIPVATLGQPAHGGPHSVTYPHDEAAGQPTLHSEPRNGGRVRWDEFQRSPERRRRLEPQTFESLSESLLRRRRRRRRRERVIDAPDDAARAFLRASAVALDELGATLVVIPA